MKNLVLEITQVGKDTQIVEVERGSVFVYMGEWTYYLDNSTGEEILERWKTEDDSYENDNQQELPTWNRTQFHEIVSSDELSGTV